MQTVENQCWRRGNLREKEQQRETAVSFLLQPPQSSRQMEESGGKLNRGK